MGKPVYRQWAEVPATLATKTQLGVEGLRLAKEQPVIAYKTGLRGDRYALYERGAAIAKRPATPAQLAALAAARAVVCEVCGDAPARVGSLTNGLCNGCVVKRRKAWQLKVDADLVSSWARELLASDALILDSETTGLGGDAEIIELGVIDMAGQVIFNRRLRPLGSIDPGAGRVHGITLADLAAAPTLPDLYADLVALLTGRRLVIYNAAFDERMIYQSCRAWDLAPIPIVSTCAMVQYTAFCGRTRWVGLREGDHSAVGDCRAVLALLQQMAGTAEAVTG